jgi:hypothetical protein
MTSVKLDVGRLMLGHVRNAVKELQHMGYNASLTEGEGFFSRPVWLKFDDAALPHIKQWLKQFEE